jgi:GntR family transcriptional regulator, transcriptional repressor for pyruvate dehydrogenase complex
MTKQRTRKGVVLNRVSVPKTYDVLAAQLRETILGGEIAEGESLPTERELVSQTGLSRGSVREALRMLAVEGLVRPRHGRLGGNIVSLPNNEAMAHFISQFVRGRKLSIRTLQETRETLEPTLARLAAERRSTDDVAKLKVLNEDLSAAVSDRMQFAAINVEWHNAVAAASRNDLLAAFLFSMSFGVAISTTADEYDTIEVRKAAVDAHTKIIGAIEAQNPDLAFRRMEQHVRATRAVTRARENSELKFK